MKAAHSLLLAATLALLLPGQGLRAQDGADKPALDHDDYAVWNRIADETMSPDGAWLAYALVPGDGDATLVVREVASGRELRLARGADPVFTDDSRFLAVRVAPLQDSVEAAEEAKEDDPSVEPPTDSLAVVDLARAFGDGEPTPGSDAVSRIARVKSFQVPEEERALVAYHLEPEKEDGEEGEGDAGAGAEEEEPGEEASGDEEEDDRPEKAEGSTLVLLDPATGAEHRFEHATEYAFDERGRVLAYLAQSEDGAADGAYRVDTANGEARALLAGEGQYEQIAVADDGAAVAFLSSRDRWVDEQPAHALYLAEGDAGAAVLVAHDAPGLPDGWWVSGNGDVRFSEEGSRVMFGTAPRPEPEEDGDAEPEVPGIDDPELAGELEDVALDVWNWKDDYLQPMQLIQAEQDEDRAYLAVAPVAGGGMTQLATETMPAVTVADEGEGDLAFGQTDLPYRKLLSWDGRYNDLYLIDVATGDRRRVAEKVKGFSGGSFSPEGRFVYWWDGGELDWYAYDTGEDRTVNLTEDLDVAFWDELDDHPDEPPQYGTAGWTDDGRFVAYDRFDVWLLDPSGERPAVNATEGVGRREGIRFRYQPLDDEGGLAFFFGFGAGDELLPTDEDVVLSAFHHTTKEAGYYRDRLSGSAEPERLIWGPCDFGPPRKAEDADRLLLTRETFQEFPDLRIADMDFGGMEKVSDANPQQDEYRWGTAELVEWTSNDGQPLQGILYKPEGFDPTQEYPMMVYFYERLSDGLHGYTVPAPGSSSINRSFYVSRGYLLFVPDIPYEIGFPGESAVDAVVPGVLNLIDMGFVDADRIGVQGHSWGGYQIAHMITRSNIFAAAEAGAPVSNMISAYGGIRWGSGMSRMFQYERTQSRIGGTLWNAQHRYIENSPIFFADKIETPLLMMHNDEDGAVPWYQGIEMFVAMRRLAKPVWMLNYNGEAHGLRQEHNQLDWAIRMQQFFDHFLKDAPPPRWLAEGVPADEKGEDWGFELLTGEEAREKPVTEAGAAGG